MNYRLSPTGQMLTEIQYTENPEEQKMLRKPIGRWGRMWQDWVKAEYPTEVQIFVTEGRWQIIPRIIDREAGEPLSRTGRAVPSGKSPSAGVLGNSVVGENASADGGTRDNGGNNFSVEELIERYKNADFNRRLDSFEVAGYMLYEANYNEFRAARLPF